MRNTLKLIGIIAVVLMFGLSLSSCGDAASAGILGPEPGAPILTEVTFTAAPSGSPTTTTITLTFSVPVTGLLTSHITISNGTGKATKGAFTPTSTTVYTIAVTDVEAGNVTVAVADFGNFDVTTGSQTVAVVAE